MLGLKIHSLPKLKNPNMVAALPDMGNVAGIGVEFLIKNLKAKLFAELYAYWPPAVSYDGGLVKFDQSSYKFHYCEKENLIIFSGDFNPSDPRRLYEICYEAVEMAKKLKAAKLILTTLFELLKIKPLDMKDLEEEEKRKKFMEQQMSYMDNVMRRDKQPGIA